MKYETKKKIKENMQSFVEWFYLKFIRPIKKKYKRNQYEKRQRILNQAIGEVVREFDQFMVFALDETIKEYRESKQQNYYTVQAMHDIRKLHEKTLKRYILGKK